MDATLSTFFQWQYDRTALIYASRYGHTAIVKLLLEADAEKDASDKVRVCVALVLHGHTYNSDECYTLGSRGHRHSRARRYKHIKITTVIFINCYSRSFQNVFPY